MSREIDEDGEELFPSDEQGIKEEVDEVSSDEDVEKDSEREEQIDEDAITPVEDAFMEGAERLGKGGKCVHCGKVLHDENPYEREYNGEVMWFCSENCADKYAEEHSE